MAPPLPATLVHCAVFSTSSALVASAVLGLARRLVNTAGSLPARPFLCPPAILVAIVAAARLRVTTPAGPPVVARGIPMFLGRCVAVIAVDCVLSAAAPARPSGHSPRSRRRHSSNSHSACAAARGLARSGFYEIAFAILAATVVPSDLAETSRLSRREAPAVTNQKS